MKSHYTYLLTDQVNSMFYFGVRSCVGEPRDDKYMGSSKYVNKAMSDGVKFYKAISGIYQTREEANKAEVDFLHSIDCANSEDWHNKCNSHNAMSVSCLDGKRGSGKVKLKGSNRTDAQKNAGIGRVGLSGEDRTNLQKAADERQRSLIGVLSPTYGLKHSDEAKQAISKANKGKQHTLGFKHSEEAKAKMSASMKGRKAPNKGIKHSDEAKAAMSAKHKEKLACPHCSVSMSKSNAKRYHFDNCKQIKQEVA